MIVIFKDSQPCILQILALLLKRKKHLLNTHILHLTFALVGTEDSNRESSVIPNKIAFRDLLCDLEVCDTVKPRIRTKGNLSGFYICDIQGSLYCVCLVDCLDWYSPEKDCCWLWSPCTNTINTKCMTDLTLILKWQLQPTTVLLRTTPTRPNDSEDVFPRWLSKWQSQPTTVLLRTTPTRPNDSEDVFPHWLSKWKSQPTTVLLRTTPARPNDSEDVFHTGCRNGSRNQQQSFSGLHQPGWSTKYKYWLTWIRTFHYIIKALGLNKPIMHPKKFGRLVLVLYFL